MAVPTWARTLSIAAGTGVVAGAGQLGIAYGLGIVRWDAPLADPAWHWQLTWLALFASVAVISGASLGRWSARRSGQPVGLPLHLVVSLAAAVGSAVMIPLVLHPARTAHIAEPGNPALTAVMATAAGLVLGLLAAVAVLSVPTVAGNITATVTWLWAAALGSATWTIGRGDAWGAAHPGLIGTSGPWIPAVLLGVPALIALAVAAVARFGGSGWILVAVSGVAGPALLAVAYVVGAPGGGPQTTAYRYALLGVAVAAAVSVLVAVARRPPWSALQAVRGSRPDRGEPTERADRPEPTDAPERDRPRHSRPAAVDLPKAPEPQGGGAEATTQRLPAWTDAPDDEPWPERSPSTGGTATEPPPPPPAKGRLGRRRRARGQNAADQPVSEHDSEYVDWVRTLGGRGSTS